ncbi:hypothetical protein IMZ48_34545 [Candidatus Bathyarchaeota archaeon]|nr:hypothetical protein [Candidatus Bathyarchaeota archaeon]
MSWTIYEKGHGTDAASGIGAASGPTRPGPAAQSNASAIDALDIAVIRAAREKIIMYCAGQDQGKYDKPLSWPAASTPNVLKKIGFAKSFGKEGDPVNVKNVDYLFPGTLAYSKSTDLSSSAATARAAGVAALVLWCAEACKVRGNEGGYFNFREGRRMNKLFDSLRTTPGSTSLVRFTDILTEAAKDGVDCPAEVLRRCREKLML